MKIFPLIGQKIREIRKEKKLTLNQVAKRMGFTSHVTLSVLETGKKTVTDKMLVRILTDGFDLQPSTAREMMGEWRIEEAMLKFGLEEIDRDKLAASAKNIKPPKPIDQIREALERMGLSEDDIKDIIEQVRDKKRKK